MKMGHSSDITFDKIITDINTLKFKPLMIRKTNKAGRSAGRIVSPRRGSFYRHVYRFIDFNRFSFSNEYGMILRQEHGTGRSTNIALVCFSNGGFAYILNPSKAKVGDIIRNNTLTPSQIGDSSKLRNITTGSLMHNISLSAVGRGQLTRSAGSSTILIRKEPDHCLVKLKSGELRYLTSSANATLGTVGSEDHFLKHLGKAGVTRRLGRRPRTRPSSMNPVDHPMGGRTRGGCQPMNSKGIIMTNHSTKKYYHPAIFLTKRQLKFKKF